MGIKLAIASLFFSSLTFAQVPSEIRALQWGLQNRGEPQRIAVDHYTSSLLAGVTGEDIGLPPSLEPRAHKIIVAVLDTGVDAQHPLLKDRLAGKGYNFVANNDDTADAHGHGTHVSGIILSVTPNALILPVKVVQSGPNAPIRPQEVEPGAGTALTETVAKGIEYAVAQGAQIINLSLAWPGSIRSKSVDQAVAHARERGVIIVSSAGNDSTLANVYPCIYSSVICVGAHGPDGKPAYFTNYGPMVDISAPGIAILSSWPMAKAPTTFAGQIGYEFRNGTSMAAPFAAAAAAELLAQGFSPSETKQRLILGSRDGKLDLARALNFNPSSWIIPVKKAPVDLSWDGDSPSIQTTLAFTNAGVTSGDANIEVGGKSYDYKSVAPGAIIAIPITIKISPQSESSFQLQAVINGRETPIQVQIRRILSPAQLKGTTSQVIEGFKGADGALIRSVVASDSINRLDLLRMQPAGKQIQLQLVQGTRVSGEVTVEGTLDQFLNAYRLPDGTYALIFTSKDEANRPIFDLLYFDSSLKFLRKTRIGTESTILSESFRWAKTDQNYNPLWVSNGYTPKLDQPAYDPWNPKYQDKRLYRIYFVREGQLRALKLEKSQTPLQVLPDGTVLIAEGDDYSVSYSRIAIEGGKIKSKQKLELPEYQMLIGLPTAQKVVRLDGVSEAPEDATVAVVAPSSPGNLRVTGIGPRGFDQTLPRSNKFESLVLVSGIYSAGDRTQIFAQTHYDLRFFDSKNNKVLSTSLNRYSYVPSMIFNRNFFPLVAADLTGARLPAIYIAASIANADVSEVLVADQASGRILRPAQLRIEAQGCTALGNFIEATPITPAQLVFVCGTNLVKLPITIQR